MLQWYPRWYLMARSRTVYCKCCGASKVVSKTSSYIGVDLFSKGTYSKYRARVRDNSGKVHHLGYFATDYEASRVCDKHIIDNKVDKRPLNHSRDSYRV